MQPLPARPAKARRARRADHFTGPYASEDLIDLHGRTIESQGPTVEGAIGDGGRWRQGPMVGLPGSRARKAARSARSSTSKVVLTGPVTSCLGVMGGWW